MSNIIKFPMKRYDLEALVAAIKDAAYSTAGGLTLTEVVGALELAKLEIVEEQKEFD